MRHIVLTQEKRISLDDSLIIEADARIALYRLPDKSIQCCVTSPPYWSLRDYSIPGQIGLEASVDQFVHRLTQCFTEVKRVLKDDGVLWLNIGDAYTSGDRAYRAPDRKNPVRAMTYRPDTPEGLKAKDLIGIPWKLAFALQADGWYLRADVIWHKPNCMPESVKDRPTRSHEYMFLLSKSERYYYNHEAVREENGRNRRSVWSVPTQPFEGAHFATFPPALIEPCVLAGSRPGDFVLDPFFGSGTVGVVCGALGRRFVGIELNPEYVRIARCRLETLADRPFAFMGGVGYEQKEISLA